MKPYNTRPTNTDWRYHDSRLSHAEQFRRYVEFEAFRERRSMQQRGHWITKLLIAVIGIAVFATVGVLAGFIER